MIETVECIAKLQEFLIRNGIKNELYELILREYIANKSIVTPTNEYLTYSFELFSWGFLEMYLTPVWEHGSQVGYIHRFAP